MSAPKPPTTAEIHERAEYMRHHGLWVVNALHPTESDRFGFRLWSASLGEYVAPWRADVCEARADFDDALTHRFPVPGPARV